MTIANKEYASRIAAVDGGHGEVDGQLHRSCHGPRSEKRTGDLGEVLLDFLDGIRPGHGSTVGQLLARRVIR
ncbi:MAG: hypothetical protein WKF60_08375 [Ilumatobacter sp.]